MKHIFFILFLSFLSVNTLFSQVNSNIPRIIDFSLKENKLLDDTISSKILEIPFLGFDFDFKSDPGVYNFFTKNGTNFILDLQAYKDHVDNAAYHLIDVNNSLLYYAFRHKKNVYSLGLSHRLFAETSLSSELVSLLVDGNYQYLNKTFILDESIYGHAVNYFSIFFGYAKKIQDKMSINSKFKLIKGVASLGMENQQSSFLFSDNFNTLDNPISSEFYSDASYFINSNYKPFSNLGFAVDLFLDYDYNERFSFYTKTSDLGFIVWQENEYISQGHYSFDGLDYQLDTTLSYAFNNLKDDLDTFFSGDSVYTNKLRILPFEVNLGINYSFNDGSHQINTNYSVQKLYKTLLHTVQISYLRYFADYNFAIIPSYSINKFNYTNFSIALNKKWKNRFCTSFYIENIFAFLPVKANGNNIGFGWELYLLF